MSKNNKPKKDNAKETPFDFLTEVKMLNLTVTVKDQEIYRLNDSYSQLRQKYIKLETEHEELQKNFTLMFDDMKTSNQLKEQLDHMTKQLFHAEESMTNIKKEYEEEKVELIKKYESEIFKYKSQLESFYKKIEQYNTLYNLSQKQDETIKQLEIEKQEIKKEADDAVQSNFVKNEIKFSNLKNKMLDNIKEMQKNVSQLNIEYMDASSKLTLLQNHQLLIELEYQTQEIEELYKKKAALEKRIFELTHDLEIHKEVEKKLADKNQKLREFVENDEDNRDTSSRKYKSSNRLSCDNCKNNAADHNKLAKSAVISYMNISTCSTYDTRISKLESTLKKRDIEFKILRNKYDMLYEKQLASDKKYAGLYKLFESGLAYLSEKEETKEIVDDFSSSEAIRSGDFSAFELNEKYNMVILLINFLIPLISPEYLQTYQLGDIERFMYVEKTKSDPLLKKIFPFWKKPGEVNISVMNPVKRSYDGLPIISNSRYKV
jgi:myosin heavy subunit